jgi:hypothetical protein
MHPTDPRFTDRQMDMLNAITKKKDWKTKIRKPEIVCRWKNEFCSQGADRKIIDKVFELLELSLNESMDYDHGDEYKWILDVTTNPGVIGLVCNGCECRVCGDYYHSDSDDCSSDDQEEHIKRSEINCSCDAVLNLKKMKQKYLEKNVVIDDKFLDSNTRNKFIRAVDRFTKNKQKDYHPGSSDTVVDILHPSLYCYVDGITQTHGTNGLEKPSLFQWIPANYSSVDQKFTSQIHGLDQTDHPVLHDSIENIFGLFLKHFHQMFLNLYQNNKMDQMINLNDYQELQVIVKISSTELTPGNPCSSSSSWHLEGCETEKIIGTGIYFYDMQNITDSYLGFRTAVNEDIDYPQGHGDFVKAHYGLVQIDGDGENMQSVMPLGKIHTKKGMGLVFPNFLQHKVEEFKLVDKTKSGHRDILVFFLIDPRTRIISTANVVQNKNNENAMTLRDAKIYRELLMFQRKYETKGQTNFFERGWSLCEH